MQITDSFIWLASASAVLANAGIFRYRAESLGEEDPRLKPGYVAIARGTALWLLPPVVMLGVGDVLGWNGAYAFPQRGAQATLFDLACYVVFTGIVIRGLFWVLVQGGAAFLAEHRRVFNMFPSSAKTVSFMWVVVSIALLAMWTGALLTAVGGGAE